MKTTVKTVQVVTNGQGFNVPIDPDRDPAEPEVMLIDQTADTSVTTLSLYRTLFVSSETRSSPRRAHSRLSTWI